MQVKQIIVVAAVASLMGILSTLSIHKAGHPALQNGHATKSVSKHDESELILKQKSILTAAQVQEINSLEKDAKINIGELAYLKLAKKWDDFKQPGIAGLYYFQAAKSNQNVKSWLLAGDKMRTSLVNQPDSIASPIYFDKAISAYQEVLKLDPENLDAKTGMGVCYVSGSSNPMQGISLLLGVVSKDPQNVNANFNLGLFSMRSGQYQKAVGRFQTVVMKAPTGEAYFYLAQAYQNLNQKSEAIAAYLNSKKYITDAETLSSIDHLIKQLK